MRLNYYTRRTIKSAIVNMESARLEAMHNQRRALIDEQDVVRRVYDHVIGRIDPDVAAALEVLKQQAPDYLLLTTSLSLYVRDTRQYVDLALPESWPIVRSGFRYEVTDPQLTRDLAVVAGGASLIDNIVRSISQAAYILLESERSLEPIIKAWPRCVDYLTEAQKEQLSPRSRLVPSEATLCAASELAVLLDTAAEKVDPFLT